MDDMIREIIEAFDAARVEFDEKNSGDFRACLCANQANPNARSLKIFTKYICPVLEKRLADNPGQPRFTVMIDGVVPDDLEDCKLTYRGNLYAITRVEED